MVIRVAELFAGVGGFRLGFEGLPSGPRNNTFKVVWSNQWEPSTKKQHATEVYVKQWNMIPTDEDPDAAAAQITDAEYQKDTKSAEI